MYFGRWMTATRVRLSPSRRTTTPPAALMSGLASLVVFSLRRATGAEGYAQEPDSIRPARNHRRVLLARIVCSDPDCDEELEITVETLTKLDGYVCECGHGFVLESVSELKEPGGEVISIAERIEQPERRAA